MEFSENFKKNWDKSWPKMEQQKQINQTDLTKYCTWWDDTSRNNNQIFKIIQSE